MLYLVVCIVHIRYTYVSARTQDCQEPCNKSDKWATLKYRRWGRLGVGQGAALPQRLTQPLQHRDFGPCPHLGFDVPVPDTRDMPSRSRGLLCARGSKSRWALSVMLTHANTAARANGCHTDSAEKNPHTKDVVAGLERYWPHAHLWSRNTSRSLWRLLYGKVLSIAVDFDFPDYVLSEQCVCTTFVKSLRWRWTVIGSRRPSARHSSLASLSNDELHCLDSTHNGHQSQWGPQQSKQSPCCGWYPLEFRRNPA